MKSLNEEIAEIVAKRFKEFNNHIGKTAKSLNISRNTLKKYLKLSNRELNINIQDLKQQVRESVELYERNKRAFEFAKTKVKFLENKYQNLIDIPITID